MKRAISFYEKLFNKKVDVFDERFSIFKIEGFSFGLFDPKKDDEKFTLGNNIIPDIEVKDIDKEYSKIKDMGAKIVLEPKTHVNRLKLFQFQDSEGNIIEIYSKKF